jgi:hypothetical protein
LAGLGVDTELQQRTGHALAESHLERRKRMEIVLLLIAVVAAWFLLPKLIDRLGTSAAHVVFKKDNARAQELSERRLRLEVPGVQPRGLIGAIVNEAGFATEKSWRSGVYIAGWDDGHIVFEYTRKTNLEESPFTATLVATPNGTGDGSIAEYGVAQYVEFGGQALGVDEMEQTERTLGKFIKWKFPETKVIS